MTEEYYTILASFGGKLSTLCDRIAKLGTATPPCHTVWSERSERNRSTH